MKKTFQLFNALLISVISTLVLLTISFLFMLFSSKEDGYRTTFFGSIFFNSTTKSNGAIDLSFGIHNFEPIIYTIISILGFTLLTMSVYKQLLLRKDTLIQNNENKN